MKTTLDLPDPLMRRVKIRAATEGRKLKDLIAELLDHGLHARELPGAAEDESPYFINEKTGSPVIRSRRTPGFVPLTEREAKHLINLAQEEEDLGSAGLLR